MLGTKVFPRAVSDGQVLASLLEGLATPLALLLDAGSSAALSMLHRISKPACSDSLVLEERDIRYASLYPDPLGKTNFFVLSEKYLGTRES